MINGSLAGVDRGLRGGGWGRNEAQTCKFESMIEHMKKNVALICIS